MAEELQVLPRRFIRAASILRLLILARLALNDERSKARMLLTKAADLLADANTQYDSDLASSEEECSSDQIGRRFAYWQLKEVDAFISRNIGGPIAVEDLAERANLSVSYFCRVFRWTFQEPPRAHIIRRRLEHAQSAMISTDLPIGAISRTSGFQDQSAFCRAFRRYVGTTPGNWRRVNKQYTHRPVR